KKGKIDVECDDDFRQSRRSQICMDNLRERLLSSQGWSILRFEKREISSNLSSCFELIEKIINSKGGVQNQNSIRKYFKNQKLEQLILD
ncbi:MAG: endonuclease domain-containing protein, partial [candidate division Zixibacteria bacterium]|nr:endonuclease domain-containing protein [candidate division Zixibacteria bacterium]